MNLKASISEAMKHNKAATLVNRLDECKGSFAVKYVLEELLKVENDNKIKHILDLINSVIYKNYDGAIISKTDGTVLKR